MPADGNTGQGGVCRKGQYPLTRAQPDGNLVSGHVGPVAVVATRQRWDRFVWRRLDATGHHRMQTVGADDDPGALLDLVAGGVTAANADHTFAIPEQIVSRECLADVGTGLRRRLDEQCVQSVAAGGERARWLTVWPAKSTGEVDCAEVHPHGMHGPGAAGRQHPVEQTPALEAADPRGVDV